MSADRRSQTAATAGCEITYVALFRIRAAVEAATVVGRIRQDELAGRRKRRTPTLLEPEFPISTSSLRQNHTAAALGSHRRWQNKGGIPSYYSGPWGPLLAGCG